MAFDVSKLKWTRQPKSSSITADKIEITTEPHTDLWQRTYYHFRNDNAPVLQMTTSEQFFSFTIKTEFDCHQRFDQSGIVMYLDSDNWIKCSIEYENESLRYLGSVVTNNGYSDWATTEVKSEIKSMWFRLSRREDDFCLECSQDGKNFQLMRICHMFNVKDEVSFGIYACSPEESSFTASFTNLDFGECQWKEHDGQAPDEDWK